ncbi:SAM-dependent DNA methyltransferase [Lactobacillus helsingborgensis]|uniref:SAM-dependent DNA methyltransferase n=1 Tax=Lactobacillus helsingborgensis TaxID=1218494 RepID=UPI002264F6F1|nr:SAM-dependent DNA methyltransferase [Lactobacillus helsingborgensis]UZX32445.1 SAM-dependent DNA methyltransferase [Lactobacillus helsingborgensis]
MTGMKDKITKETIYKLLGIKDIETYKVPGKLFQILLNKSERVKVFEKFLSVSDVLTKDWFFDYFQTEQAEMNRQKQDLTPNNLSKLLAQLSHNDWKWNNSGIRLDVGAGTGTLTIAKWVEDQVKHDSLVYKPHNYLYFCEEKSDQAIPFLIFNLAIRGMNAVVWHGDSLTRKCKGVFFIENCLDDAHSFSDVNIMPYTKEVKEYFSVSDGSKERYPKHIETFLKIETTLNGKTTALVYGDK